MTLRFESVVWALNPKLSHHRFSIPNLRRNPHSLFAPPPPRIRISFLAFEEGGGEIEPEKNENNNDNRTGAEESWKQALDTFREQASKIREASQEAYELYSEKAIAVLKDATEELRVAAKEIGDEGKQYLTVVAENSPEIKEVVETFTSPNRDLSEISQLRDFYVGVPYGLVLSVGGFVSFMVTGSIAALRFGIVLGGVLLALGVSSLRAYKRGQPSSLMLKGQTAIASILFLREIRLLAAEVHRLVTQRKKCSFGETSVEYLGHVISVARVAMNPTKIQAVLNWPQPHDVKGVRGFLGLTGYYRQFIQDYGKIAQPLIELTKKDNFCWGTTAQIAFDKLKKVLTFAPVLTLPDFTKEFVIECDASGIGLGAVLMQDKKPIAYFSKTLVAAI